MPSSVPIITRDQVERAKPDPDLFLAAATKLGVDTADSIVVGTVFGICLPREEPGLWEWAFYPAAMAMMNSSAPALIASIRIRTTC